MCIRDRYVAFIFEGRNYQFKQLPFGLLISVALFVRCMDQILGCLLYTSQLTEYREELKQTVMETEEKIERTNETVLQVREEILTKVNEAEGESKRRIEGLQQETTNKFEQVQTRTEERYNQLDASVSEVKDTTTAQEGKLEEFRVRELRLQEEINACLLYTSRCV